MRLFARLLAPAVFLLATVSAQADVVADLQSLLSNLHTMQGEFTQTVVNRSGKKQVSTGDFAISRPGKFRWNYQKPYEQLIVSDGKQVWLYDPDLNQVTIKQIDKALDASPAALLSGDNNLEKRYQLKVLAARDGVNWVEAVPRQNDSNFNRIRLGFSGNDIRKMELEDNFGQSTQIELRSVNNNGKPNPALFSFTTPKGADEIRQ